MSKVLVNLSLAWANTFLFLTLPLVAVLVLETTAKSIVTVSAHMTILILKKKIVTLKVESRKDDHTRLPTNRPTFSWRRTELLGDGTLSI